MVNSHAIADPSELPFRLIIAGCGSRGLSVLERVATLAAASGTRIDVIIIDPQEPGPGLHTPNQPDYLMLNTVASQLSMFPDAAALDGKKGREGPNFYQWCASNKSEFRPKRFVEESPQPAGPADFLPRSWLGQYLAWTYRHVIDTLPANVSVRHVADRVVSIAREGADGYAVTTAAGTAYSGNALAVTIGHSAARTAVHGNHSAARSEPGEWIALDGLGLAAMDALAACTVGKGGRFHRDDAGPLVYRPSGLEPRIVMYSRGGLPYRTRADIEPGARPSRPVIFTSEAAASLRSSHPGGMDFERDVLPLVKAEMTAAYYGTAARCAAGGSMAAGELQRDQIAAWFRANMLEERMPALAARFGAFDPAQLLLTELPAEANGAGYQEWMSAFIAADLHASRVGLANSPLKAAAEVWRDCREQLRRITDDRGLAPASDALFRKRYAPLVNRLVAGPQKERHDELLALMDAGVVKLLRVAQLTPCDKGVILALAGSDTTVKVQRIIGAHVVDNRSPEYQPEPIASMRRAHLLQSLDADGYGVRTDSQGRAIDAEGRVASNLWLLGPVVEGATYYNHYVPSAGGYSRAFVDAHRIAAAVVAVATRQSTQAACSSFA